MTSVIYFTHQFAGVLIGGGYSTIVRDVSAHPQGFPYVQSVIDKYVSIPYLDLVNEDETKSFKYVRRLHIKQSSNITAPSEVRSVRTS